MTALRACASVGARGRITIHWRRERNSGVDYRIDAQAEQLDSVTPCVERTFRRFEPCHSEEVEGTVSLIFAK
jgi:hypothetical protein